jgi:hypothetical protein
MNGTSGFYIGLSVKNMPKDVEFTISNSGDIDLILTCIPTLSNSNGFTVNPPNGNIITGKGYKHFTIIFMLPEVDDYSAEISIETNAQKDNPFTFGIIGTGVKDEESR